jgi:hypothetical protein
MLAASSPFPGRLGCSRYRSGIREFWQARTSEAGGLTLTSRHAHKSRIRPPSVGSSGPTFRNPRAIDGASPLLPASLPTGTVLLEWRTVFAWLRQHSFDSTWAARTADYLEIAEAKLIETKQFVEGTLTMFSGFPFGHDHPFNYLEGKKHFPSVHTCARARARAPARRAIRPLVTCEEASGGST